MNTHFHSMVDLSIVFCMFTGGYMMLWETRTSWETSMLSGSDAQQLLVWPGLVDETLPQLLMKTRLSAAPTTSDKGL